MRLFVSYAREDRPRAEALALRLRQAGCATWLDSDLAGGQVWWDGVLDQLRACDAMVAAISGAWIGSNVCRSEHEYASALGKPIMPVILEHVELEMLPSDVLERQFIDYSKPNEAAAAQLIGAVFALRPAASRPDPLPPPPEAPVLGPDEPPGPGTAASGPGVPSRIFISYRRKDQLAAYLAGFLFERLAREFGEAMVFKDIDSIEPGDDFVEKINNAIESCAVLLALIGDGWLTATDEEGQQRLDNPDDPVRLEIEAALARNVRVIPVLVGGAQMPSARQLPDTLARLARRQAQPVSPTQLNADIGRLLKVLERTFAGAQPPSRP